MNLLAFKTLKYVGKDGGYFGSPHPSFPFTWGTSRLVEAECKKCGDERPGDRCSCGIYATYVLSVAAEYWVQTACVLTLVEAGDKTVVYSGGWRSRQAYVRAIVNYSLHSGGIGRYSERIGLQQFGMIYATQYWPEVPVISVAQAQQAIKEQVDAFHRWKG